MTDRLTGDPARDTTADPTGDVTELELGLALAEPHTLDVSTRRSESGDWVCRLEYPELAGCVSEARDVFDALDRLEEMRELWLRERLATGGGLPVVRAPLAA